MSKITAILGSQWGDEGKGKLVDILASDFDIIARATGGANAGHTIYVDGKKFIFHLIPSGMLHDEKICVIGNGVAIHLETMFKELKSLEEAGINLDGKLLISNRASVLFDYHKILDGMQEDSRGKSKVGTTKRGIGPCYTDKIRRNGIRIADMLDFSSFEEKYRNNLQMIKKQHGEFDYDEDNELEMHRKYIEKLKPMLIDSAAYLNKALEDGKNIMVEGANGMMLDIDHGTYPYVTSSNPTIGGIFTGTGLSAKHLDKTIGIVKAYTTRVGGGPFPTELTDDLGEEIRQNGGEFGSTTGRPRRCGWFDAVVARYSAIVNGYTDLNLTKLDVLTGLPTLKIATAYKINGENISGFPATSSQLEKVEVEYVEMPGWEEDISKTKDFEQLPENAKNYVKKIEELIQVPITSIGVGVDRNDMIFIDS